jgi:hypothetical protein
MTAPQQQSFTDAMRGGQEMVAQAVKVWQDAVTEAASKMTRNVEQFSNSLTSAEGHADAQQGVANTVVDSVFDFAEHLLTSQRAFVKSLLATGTGTWSAATDATKQAGETTAQTTAQATRDTASQS